MENIIINIFTLDFFLVYWLVIISHKKTVPEGRCAVKLLKHGDHITDTAKVFNPEVSQRRFMLEFIAKWTYIAHVRDSRA